MLMTRASLVVVTMAASASATSHAPLAAAAGIALHRAVHITCPAGSRWFDATAAVSAALPALPAAVVNIACTAGASHSVSLLDPRLLSLGNSNSYGSSLLANQEVAIAMHGGELLLPRAARLVLMLQDAAGCEACRECELIVTVEVAKALADEPPGLLPHAQLAKAALMSCLAEAAIPAEEIRGLQSAMDAGASSAAQKVFASFVLAGGCSEQKPAAAVKRRRRGGGGKGAAAEDEDGNGSTAKAAAARGSDGNGSGGGEEGVAEKPAYPAGEALLASARRAAHHIGHLLRQERVVAAADWYRNTDAPVEEQTFARPTVHPVHVVLDNVRSAYNVGSIFRSADTAAVAEVITCGFTPHPPHPKLAKTGFGAVDHVPTRHFESTQAALHALRSEGVAIAAMETTERSVNYAQLDFPPTGVALILGNEEVGVDTAVLEMCDEIVEIPTLGTKNSLNICSAATVVLYEILRQWGALEDAGDAGRRAFRRQQASE